MNFHVLTLFPEMIRQGLSASIIGKAIEKGNIRVDAVDIRDFTKDKHGKVDDYTYGGGAGLLMQAQPVCDAHRFVREKIGNGKSVRTIYLTPQGRTFNQRMAEELAGEEDLIFLCGHYEGIDERALDKVVTDYVSLGDFVLTGGELPAMVMIDAIARLVPGVLHNDDSAADESFSGYLLEYPQYSRPEVFEGVRVPEALLSGDHRRIRKWRQEMAEERTRKRRPDLYALYESICACRTELAKDKLHHMAMTELIARGQAKLLFHDGNGTLLQDRKSGAFFLTAKNREAGCAILDAVFKETDCVQEPGEIRLFVSHQEFMNDIIQERFSLQVPGACSQWVYTKKESLPAPKADIRRLTAEFLQEVAAAYDLIPEAELKVRLQCGAVYGVFVEEKLAGFIGEHEEGGMGMLYVYPEYRGRGLAKALETYLINNTLQRGYTPFCQVFEGNDISERMQESLGLYCAKEKVWWFQK